MLFVPQFVENDKEMHPAIRVPVIRHSGSDEGGELMESFSPCQIFQVKVLGTYIYRHTVYYNGQNTLFVRLLRGKVYVLIISAIRPSTCRY